MRNIGHTVCQNEGLGMDQRFLFKLKFGCRSRWLRLDSRRYSDSVLPLYFTKRQGADKHIDSVSLQ